jgi:hypothetical protein
MSKALATFATQPLIVAKVGLQSRPPASRNGKPFKSFGEVMSYIVEHEGVMSLFKGIGPQLLKGLLVQGFLMMTKERYVISTPPTTNTADKEIAWSYHSSSFSDTSASCDQSNSQSWQRWRPRKPDEVVLSS